MLPPKEQATYRQRGEEDIDEIRAKAAAYHAKLPDVYGMPSRRDPSGLVPAPCKHGIPVKPKRFPPTKGGNPWLDDDGNERPPFGAQSWVRAKHLTSMRVTMNNGVVSAIPMCPVCLGLPAPDDLTTPADE